MTSVLPITLTGDTLGKRHKQINTLVKESYERYENFKNVQNAPEKSVIDRLFKIDLASKHRNVEYIKENLKDADMLYVSRALKANWLLEPKYQDIINPEYLENNLYPYMITTAVTKMKHWIHLHLKDEQRSEKFYEFYKEKEFELAMKFLVKSSPDIIMKEFPKIVDVVSPKYYKLLCERNAQVAKIFYDSVESDEKQKARYLYNEKDFYLSMKCMLKSDPNLYLDITEKYFNIHRFKRFSSIATKFIMNHHKDRVLKKPELYTSRILDLATMAQILSEEEVKDLIIQLAKATYIDVWFKYENIEPLIKKIKPENRAAFKKKVFVDEDIGDEVEEWPYEEPSAPQMEGPRPDIFKDREHEPHEYERYGLEGVKKIKRIKLRGGGDGKVVRSACLHKDTELDKLFNEFRFVGFEKTFYELRKRILAESSSQNRQYIMLVLVSKSGGRPEAIATLMDLLAKHSNEPPNLRAAIIRSLVNRAFVWRLPQKTWKQFLEFGIGLGLDGSPPEADCIEGLHAVFIRMLLKSNLVAKSNVDANILKLFLEQFSDLSSYKLTAIEKKCVSEELPKLLLSAAKDKVNVNDAIDILRKLIEVLRAFHLKVDTYPGFIPTIIDLATKDLASCIPFLESLYKSKIGRKDLFKYTFQFMKTDASHLNALKHDISVLDFELNESSRGATKFERFLRKITIYFNENSGLAVQYRNKLKLKENNKLIGRPLAMLLGVELLSYIQNVDKEDKIESKVFAAVLRANAHLARPFIDIDSLGWQKAGAKMIANKLTICPLVDVENNVQKLVKSKRTAKMALLLSKRNKTFTDVFVKTAKLRPSMAIKAGFKRMQEQGDKVYPTVWLTMKPLIEQMNFDKGTKTVHIKKLISDVNAVPVKIRPEYCVTLFKTFDKIDSFERFVRMQWLCRIENLLPDVDESFIEQIITKFLVEFNPEKVDDMYEDDCADNLLFIRVIFTYIYISKSEKTFNRRFELFGTKFLAKMTQIFKTPHKTGIFFNILDEILLNFKNTKVFMNPEYVSCLFLMEKTEHWMQTIFPIDQHFKKYVNIHLTMLYYKTIRQTVIESPEVFETETRKCKEAVTMVGKLFGKHIAKAVKDLIANYFESIIYLYKDALVQYLNRYFIYPHSSDFLSAVIKVLLEEDSDVARLGIYVFKDQYNNIDRKKYAEISKFFRYSNLKNKFFVYAEMLS